MLWIVDMKNKRRVKLRDEVAKVYAEIFREEPWTENIHPNEVIRAMIEQFFRPGKVIALAGILVGLKPPKVVSFGWMYEIFKSDLKEGTRFSPALNVLFSGGKKIFYLQEIAVEKEHRKKGIGERLIKKLLKKAKKNGGDIIILSTNYKAKAAKGLFSKVGFKNSGIIRPPAELGRTYWTLDLKD